MYDEITSISKNSLVSSTTYRYACLAYLVRLERCLAAEQWSL